MCLGQNIPKRAIQRIANLDGSATQEPLIIRVIVDPDNIETIRSSAQFGMQLACQYVPGFKLRRAGMRCCSPHGRRAGHYMDDRVNSDETGAWINLEDGAGPCYRRPQQLTLQLHAPARRARRKQPHVAARPRPERDLVDWTVKQNISCFVAHEPGNGCGISAIAIREVAGPDVYVFRPAVVAQVP